MLLLPRVGLVVCLDDRPLLEGVGLVGLVRADHGLVDAPRAVQALGLLGDVGLVGGLEGFGGAHGSIVSHRAACKPPSTRPVAASVRPGRPRRTATRRRRARRTPARGRRTPRRGPAAPTARRWSPPRRTPGSRRRGSR